MLECNGQLELGMFRKQFGRHESVAGNRWSPRLQTRQNTLRSPQTTGPLLSHEYHKFLVADTNSTGTDLRNALWMIQQFFSHLRTRLCTKWIQILFAARASLSLFIQIFIVHVINYTICCWDFFPVICCRNTWEFPVSVSNIFSPEHAKSGGNSENLTEMKNSWVTWSSIQNQTRLLWRETPTRSLCFYVQKVKIKYQYQYQ